MPDQVTTITKQNWVNTLLRSKATAVAGIVGAGVGVHEVFDILKSDPAKTLAILDKWGPAFVIVFLLVWIVGRALDRAGDIAQQNAEAQRQMAEAITKIANKDDAEAQRQTLLIDYAASEAKNMREQMALQSTALDRIERAITHNLTLTAAEKEAPAK